MSRPDIHDVIEHYPIVTGVHKAALLFPEPTDEDFEELRKDIEANGLRHDIILTLTGELIDGRNRLICCYLGEVEPRFRKTGEDPLSVSLGENLKRRHLTQAQKSALTCDVSDYLKDLAKENQRKGGGDKKSEQAKSGFSNLKNPIEEIEPIHTHKEAAKVVGIGATSAAKVSTIQTEAPELIDKLRSNETTVDKAYQEARKRKQQRKQIEEPQAKRVNLQTITTVDGNEKQIPASEKPTFNRTNDSIDWAWWSWNPVTGCHHGCSFCYAREIATRFKDAFPNGFEPTFLPHRLSAPANTKLPESDDPRSKRVFVCSMADLFGKWVPKQWIKDVFQACLDNPQWQYLFLTKWPKSYEQMPLIEGAWYGASVVAQKDVKRIESSMGKIADLSVTRWVSMEPMLEPIQFSDLSWCDLMVIGAQTETHQPDGPSPAFSPKLDWIVDVIIECRNHGVPVYLKENLRDGKPGVSLPKMSPKGVL